MNLNKYGIQKMVASLASSIGLRVKYIKEWKAYTDSRYIYVPEIKTTWDQEHIRMFFAFVYHEIGHNKNPATDFWPWAKESNVDMSSTYGRMINQIDDYRQEHVHSGVYEGMDRMLSEGRTAIQTKAGSEALEEFKSAGVPDGVLPFIATQAALDITREQFQKDLVACRGMNQELLDAVPGARDGYQKIMDSGVMEEVHAARTIIDVQRCAERILDLLGVDQEQAKQDGFQGAAQQLSEAAQELMNGMLMDDHALDKEAAEAASGGDPAAQAKYKAKQERLKQKSTSNLDLPDQDEPGDYHPGTLHEYDMSNPNEEHYPYEVEWASGGRALAATMRKIIQIRTQQGWEYGNRSGRLASKDLSRVLVGGDKVFRRKDQRLSLDVCVSLLVDRSGSMGGSRWDHAASAAVLMGESLGVLQVPYEINAFDDDGDHYRYILKKFNERVSIEAVKERFSRVSPGYCNADGEAILWAYHRIIQQPQKRKLLVVFSDGQPRDTAGIGAYTKAVIQNVEKSEVEIYGVGIESNAVSRYYKDHVVIHDASELEAALIKIISAKLY